jgi:hypothetical protein
MWIVWLVKVLTKEKIMRNYEKTEEIRSAISASTDAAYIAKYARPSAPWAYRYRALGNVCCPIDLLEAAMVRDKHFDIELMHMAKKTLSKIKEIA